VSANEPDVIFEITRIGDIQRVAAVHVPTGVEVVLQAPAKAALADVRALALRKLERALKGDADGGDKPDNRPGKLV
jgi:voltage-gated potassium channel Kch